MAKLMIYDGRIIDTFNMKKEDVSAEVIVLGACRINRFLGQTKYAYPVAAHLIGGYNYLLDTGASELTKKQWLIHEAFESYSGVDLPSPLKAMLPDYKKAEQNALAVIAEAFGIDPMESDEVKRLDREIMVQEALQLMPNSDYWMDFAFEQGIVPMLNGKKYVLNEANCTEAKLKETLTRIWNDVFGTKLFDNQGE